MSKPLIELQRRLKKRTQASLAKDLGFSKGFICDVLKGRKKPSTRLICALGLQVDYKRIRK